MTILEYCDETGEKLAALAKRAGMHRSHLHKIAHGQRGWTSEVAQKIFEATAGKVTPEDLRNTLYGECA